MRLTLPGGADFEQKEIPSERLVAREGAGVIERIKPKFATTPVNAAPIPSPSSTETETKPAITTERLKLAKLVFEVLVIFVGLISAVLALFGLSRK